MQHIPLQALNRWKKYDDIAFLIRKKWNHSTKIKIGKNDFLLCTRPKNSETKWTKIPPLIEPSNLPLYDVGLLSNEIKEMLVKEANERRNKKIEMNERVMSEEEINDRMEFQEQQNIISTPEDSELLELWGNAMQSQQYEDTHYYCTVCSYTITNKKEYQEHMRTQHGIIYAEPNMEQYQFDQYDDDFNETIRNAYD